MEDLENHIVNYVEKDESEYSYDDYLADRADDYCGNKED